jgi:hypothetical protein
VPEQPDKGDCIDATYAVVNIHKYEEGTMRRQGLVVVGVVIVLVSPSSILLGAVQLPLAPVRASGQTVTPVFEGWYENSDGTYSLSFGYFNRNSEEVLEIPIGPNNFMKPGNQNQGQPTQFHPRRHWGVFAARVPVDFGNQRVIWHLPNPILIRYSEASTGLTSLNDQ